MTSLLIAICTYLLASVASGAAVVQQPLRADDDNNRALSAFQQLRESVNDRLLSPTPIGSPCYGPGGSTSQACKDLNNVKQNDVWTSNQTGGYYYNNWASCQATNEACTIPVGNGSVPSDWTCHQGSVPSLAINVQSNETLLSDIEAAFAFVRETKRPFVVRNTGHDWKGRSTAPDGLALWTHRLQHPSVPIVLEHGFVPIGCENCSGEAVFHYGPGQQWGGAYYFANAHDYSVVGGTCGTVGIAGWLQGGGHSPLTPVYGMGVDNLRQVEIVTPQEGKIVANEYHNTDVFFAIRGGGGGTWGVITNITYKALPKFHVQDFHCTIDTESRDDIVHFLQAISEHAVGWSQKGWGGYIKSSPTGLIFEIMNPRMTKAQAEQDVQPIIDLARSKGVNCTVETKPSWFEYFTEHLEPAKWHQALWSLNPTSRLLSAEAFANGTRQILVDAVMRLYDDKLLFWLMFVAPTQFNHTITSSLHPSWKDAVLSIRANTKWDQFVDLQNGVPARTHFEQIHKSFEGIRKLAPDMGISISESEIWEEKPELHFWGQKNYAKLEDVKRRVDPGNIMSNYHAVGWNPNEERYRCYPRL